MAAPPKKITEILMDLDDQDARDALERIDAWTRDERIALTLLPGLMGAATTPYTTKGGKLEKGVITAVELVDELRKVHARTYEELYPGEPFECSPPTISNFKNKGQHPPGGFHLATVFLLWLSDQITDKRIQHSSRVYAMLSVFNFVRAIEDHINGQPLPQLKLGTPDEPLLAMHQVQPTEEAEQVSEDERNVSRSIGRLIGLDRIAPEVIQNDFFTDNPNQSCFVLYRRSTSENDIIKGFLVVQPPKTGQDDAYSFNHFYSDGIGNDRETRGFILSVAERHYFVGATGSLRSGRPEALPKRPLLNEGMKFLVVDRKLQAQKGSMWGALFLSNDNVFVPIAGRCILIRSKFEHSRDVKLGTVSGDLLDDIEMYCDVPRDVLTKHREGILRAIDNSFEPPRAKGGDKDLMGPLKIVPPIT